MIGYDCVVLFVCLLPLGIFLCDYRHWILVVYDKYLNYGVKKAHQAKEDACYKNVFLSDDAGGPFVVIDKRKFYLIAQNARPLKGALIGDNYYTTNPAEVLTIVEDDNF